MENIYILTDAIFIFVLSLWNHGLLTKYLIRRDTGSPCFFGASEVIARKFCV
jgi:hypothetical protein